MNSAAVIVIITPEFVSDGPLHCCDRRAAVVFPFGPSFGLFRCGRSEGRGA